MTLIYEEMMATSIVDLKHSYSDTETMLYAQSVGFGRDPVARKELPYVQEQGLPLQTIPTMATVLVPDLIPSDLGWTTHKCYTQNSDCSCIARFLLRQKYWLTNVLLRCLIAAQSAVR